MEAHLVIVPTALYHTLPQACPNTRHRTMVHPGFDHFTNKYHHALRPCIIVFIMGGQTFSTIGSELGIKGVAYIDSGIITFMQHLSFDCINMLTNQNYIIQACFHYVLMLWAWEVTGGHPVEVTSCVSIFGTLSGKGYVVLVFSPLQDSCTTAVWDFQSSPL